ncbi:MAG TPA: squalene--hopene cyclase [Pirellulales bacterium]|nr:squalene--hopene cyclase [Pirellulales bacterium]
MKAFFVWSLALMAFGRSSILAAAEPLTLETVEPPPEISPDEPLAREFSLERAAWALDSAALSWQKAHACTACHTMLPYLMARPALEAVSPSSGEVRRFFEEVVAGNREAMPDYACHDVEGAVAIGVAAALALNDRATTGKLHPLTQQALDRMWTLQRTDGSWESPFRDSPPLKLTEQYGATLAAVAAGMAPDDYAKTTAAKVGLDKIRRFLNSTPQVTLHERTMTLWASVYLEGLLPIDARDETLSLLMTAQRPDGGWSMATLVDNTADPALKDRDLAARVKAEPGYGTEFLAYIGRNGVYRSSLASDGYATGLVLYVLRQAGVPATDARMQNGVKWLKGHQRESGRWFTPSQAWHKQHLIANAGTAYAVLALQACGEVPLSRPARRP